MAVPEMLKLKEIIETLDRIETSFAGNNKTTNETRIGALRRISNAIGYINKITEENKPFQSSTLEGIKIILLGTGGE